MSRHQATHRYCFKRPWQLQVAAHCWVLPLPEGQMDPGIADIHRASASGRFRQHLALTAGCETKDPSTGRDGRVLRTMVPPGMAGTIKRQRENPEGLQKWGGRNPGVQGKRVQAGQPRIPASHLNHVAMSRHERSCSPWGHAAMKGVICSPRSLMRIMRTPSGRELRITLHRPVGPAHVPLECQILPAHDPRSAPQPCTLWVRARAKALQGLQQPAQTWTGGLQTDRVHRPRGLYRPIKRREDPLSD